MKRSFIFILLLCLPSFIHFSLEAKAQAHLAADSLFKLLDQNPSDSSAFEEIDNIINKLYYEDVELAMSIAEQELVYARRARNNLAEGRAILNVGIIYDLQANYDSALANYDKALEVAQVNKLVKLQGDIYNNFSITHAVLGNLEESISCALKALEIFEKENDSVRMARIYNNLGARYSELEHYDKALK